MEDKRDETMKKCSCCKTMLPIEKFYRNGSMTDGRSFWCKPCTLDSQKDYYANRGGKAISARWRNSTSGLKSRRRYNSSENGKIVMCRALKKHNNAYPERTGSRRALNNAVRDGRIERPSECSECSDNRIPIEAHHEDYFKPLEVEWLCRPCHLQRHNPTALEGAADGD